MGTFMVFIIQGIIMSYNKKIIITGFALILSAIAIKQSDFSIILVGLGLIFVVAGCFGKEGE